MLISAVKSQTISLAFVAAHAHARASSIIKPDQLSNRQNTSSWSDVEERGSRGERKAGDW